MPKIRSLDLVLLETSIFGVNGGYTGRYIGPRIAWILGIVNLCVTITSIVLAIIRIKFEMADEVPYLISVAMTIQFISLLVALVLQIRSFHQRHEVPFLGKGLSHLNELSNWNGDIYGCILRLVIYQALTICDVYVAVNSQEILTWNYWARIFSYWPNFVASAVIEFLGQATLLFQHEFRALCRTTEDIANERCHGKQMKNLRALNQRHASLSALANKIAQSTGFDYLLVIESEKFSLLLNVFVVINMSSLDSFDWNMKLLVLAVSIYRLERVTYSCFRGHKIIIEADRFVSTIDKIDPLDFENDESFTEFQIFRKQVRLRKLQFDCNRFLKLDMKLLFHMTRDLLGMSIILNQLHNSAIGRSKPTNATADGADNVTEYNLLNFSYMNS